MGRSRNRKKNANNSLGYFLFFSSIILGVAIVRSMAGESYPIGTDKLSGTAFFVSRRGGILLGKPAQFEKFRKDSFNEMWHAGNNPVFDSKYETWIVSGTNGDADSEITFGDEVTYTGFWTNLGDFHAQSFVVTRKCPTHEKCLETWPQLKTN